jgi:hypothetical protein
LLPPLSRSTGMSGGRKTAVNPSRLLKLAHAPLSAAVSSILESNQLAREGRITARHAPFAEHMCRVPVEHLPLLNAKFPGFDGKSGTAAHDQAMRDFHASPWSAVYAVRKRGLRHTQGRPRGIIIRPPAAQE